LENLLLKVVDARKTLVALNEVAMVELVQTVEPVAEVARVTAESASVEICSYQLQVFTLRALGSLTN
jgi:hypothetical protein